MTFNSHADADYLQGGTRMSDREQGLVDVLLHEWELSSEVGWSRRLSIHESRIALAALAAERARREQAEEERDVDAEMRKRSDEALGTRRVERDEARQELNDLRDEYYRVCDSLGQYEARVARLEQALAEALDIIVWMSGSDDFAPDGKAHKGWVKTRDKLDGLFALTRVAEPASRCER